MRFEVIDCDGDVVDTANSGAEGGDALEWHHDEVPWGRPYTLRVGDDLRTDGGQVNGCRECGVELDAGYLCDDCDRVEGWE